MFDKIPKIIELDYFGDRTVVYEYVKQGPNGEKYTEVRTYEFVNEHKGKFVYKLRSVSKLKHGESS